MWLGQGQANALPPCRTPEHIPGLDASRSTRFLVPEETLSLPRWGDLRGALKISQEKRRLTEATVMSEIDANHPSPTAAPSYHHHLKHTHTHTHTHTHPPLFGESQTKAIRLSPLSGSAPDPTALFLPPSPGAVSLSTLFCPLVSVPIPPGQFVQPDSYRAQHWVVGGA